MALIILNILACICYAIVAIKHYKQGNKGLCILWSIGSILWFILAIINISQL